jgi:hypothetical protein
MDAHAATFLDGVMTGKNSATLRLRVRASGQLSDVSRS